MTLVGLQKLMSQEVGGTTQILCVFISLEISRILFSRLDYNSALPDNCIRFRTQIVHLCGLTTLRKEEERNRIREGRWWFVIIRSGYFPQHLVLSDPQISHSYKMMMYRMI